MTEPVSLEEAKAQLRITDDASEDDLITALIVAAREHVEGYTGLVLAQRQIIQTLGSFGGRIDLHAWPIISVDSIEYRDASGTAQEIATDGWYLATGRRPARLSPAIGTIWPTTSLLPDAVTITMTAGYAEAAAVPQSIKQAMLLLVQIDYERRPATEDEERAIETKLGPHRLVTL